MRVIAKITGDAKRPLARAADPPPHDHVQIQDHWLTMATQKPHRCSNPTLHGQPGNGEARASTRAAAHLHDGARRQRGERAAREGAEGR